MAIIVFHGTPAEASLLSAALTNNCECKGGVMGMMTEKCGAHKLAVDPDHGQRWLNHLLFLRRIYKAKLDREATCDPLQFG